jgi:hypothetical protein
MRESFDAFRNNLIFDRNIKSMKKILPFFSILIMVFSKSSIKAQNEPYVYGYRSYDDFFANKKALVGKWIELNSDRKFKLLDTITQAKYKVNMKDSNFVGYTYRFKNEKYIYDKDGNTYYSFICGTKQLLVMYSCCVTSGIYDENGNMQSAVFYSGSGSYFYFVKNLDFKHSKSKFEDIIKDKPKIYDMFLAEKKADKNAFYNNHIYMYQKYIKLYEAEK